jgi:poly(hydroxyalkanoate) depolymerase family esterase
VQGARRLDYRLFVPASTPGTAAPPLLVMLHGCAQDADGFAFGTRMNTLARAAGVMVLYPDQLQRANAHNCWNWFNPQHQRRGRGEPELLADLVRTLVADHHADPARIYVAGLSAGGSMAAILATQYPELFAAAGVHSGVAPGVARDLGSAWDAMHLGPDTRGGPLAGIPLPLIVFHGDADEVVHSRNGTALAEAACHAMGLTAAPDVRTGRSADCRSFAQRVYRLPDGTNMVEHWQLRGGGHAWSGGDAAGSHCAAFGPDASAEMLRFFLSHRTVCKNAWPN